MILLKDTIVALSTARGRSALGMIRVSGSDCPSLAKAIFRRAEISVRNLYLGWYIDLNGKPLDQVTYCYFAEGASYTGEAMLELTCHGNPLILDQIVKDLCLRGCRLAEPGEFTRRAFLNGKMDLCQAEGVADLIHAQSEAALDTAKRQLKGALGEQFKNLADRLLTMVAQVEASIDFPEDDTELQQSVLASIDQVVVNLTQLIETQHRHRSLQEGLQVAIVGAPNAGKSSLLNALLGEERAIVSEEAGTTRDFISEAFRIEPFLVRLVDTAGLRDGQSLIEKKGIEKTMQLIETADCILWVVDASNPDPSGINPTLLQLLKEREVCVVYNKMDLVANTSIPNASYRFISHCSAKTGKGLHELKVALSEYLKQRFWGQSQCDVMVNSRHAQHLELAKQSLMNAATGLHFNHTIELIASDLRGALNEIGNIVGDVGTEVILDRIFGQFCIGK